MPSLVPSARKRVPRANPAIDWSAGTSVEARKHKSDTDFSVVASGVPPNATRRMRASVLAGSAAVWSLHVALRAPTVDHLDAETPIGADPEGGQLSTTQQLI